MRVVSIVMLVSLVLCSILPVISAAGIFSEKVAFAAYYPPDNTVDGLSPAHSSEFTKEEKLSRAKVIGDAVSGEDSAEFIEKSDLQVVTDLVPTQTQVVEYRPDEVGKGAPLSKKTANSVTQKKSYSRVITCVATAYDGSFETLGYHNPKTALGKTPVVGTVAVDPNLIPLGTKLYIETSDGSFVYGECFAGDTGGDIKGNRVDLFMASRGEALSFGRRTVNVYILD